jgi:hypothetical protein
MNHDQVIVEHTEIILEPPPDAALRSRQPVRTAHVERGRSARRATGLPAALTPIALLVPAIAYGLYRTRRHATARHLRRSRAAFAMSSVGTAIALGVAGKEIARRLVPEPAYQVERRDGAFELRRYDAAILAETTVAGLDFSAALAEGVHRLQGYLRGENAYGERIPMIGPISGRQIRGDDPTMLAPATIRRDEVAYVFSVYMPAGRSLSALPVPTDSRVELRPVPPHRMAVLKGIGAYRGSTAKKKENELLEKVVDARLVMVEHPSFAVYDPMTAFPFLRRVVATIEVL